MEKFFHLIKIPLTSPIAKAGSKEVIIMAGITVAAVPGTIAAPPAVAPPTTAPPVDPPATAPPPVLTV